MQELQLRRQKSGVFAGKSGFVTARDLLKWANRKPNGKEEAATQVGRAPNIHTVVKFDEYSMNVSLN